MDAKQIKRAAPRLPVYAITYNGEIFRVIQCGRKWITLMAQNGQTLRVTDVAAIAEFASDLPQGRNP